MAAALVRERPQDALEGITGRKQPKKEPVEVAEIGLDYVTNDDSMTRSLDAPPMIVNYFYHEWIKKSAPRDDKAHAGSGRAAHN